MVIILQGWCLQKCQHHTMSEPGGVIKKEIVVRVYHSFAEGF